MHAHSAHTHLTSFRFNQAINFIIPNNNICIIQFIYKNLFAISSERMAGVESLDDGEQWWHSMAVARVKGAT
jgi:hypothetical protein